MTEPAAPSNAPEPLDLSVIIVCFNDREVLLPCLESLYGAPCEIALEVILVDNGSKDGSIDEVRRRFPSVRILEPGYNSGYAGGNNFGFERAEGRYVLFLNPDTLLTTGALDRLVARGDANPDSGAVGPKVLNRDGSLQPSCFRSPTVGHYLAITLMLHRLPGWSRWFGADGYPDGFFEREQPADIVSGCCLLARRDLLRSIGAFNEDYFIYFEETDLCERIRRSGHAILYTPEAVITHLGGATTVKQVMWFRIQFERNRIRFFRTYRGRAAALAVSVLMTVNLLLRVILGGLGALLSAGRARGLRNRTGIAARILGWKLGLVEQGPRPS